MKIKLQILISRLYDKRSLGMIICLFLYQLQLQAQEEQPEHAFAGYIRIMPSADLTYAFDSIALNQVVHNRLKYVFSPTKSIYFHVEARNRLFSGDYVKNLDYFNQLVDINNDQLDLSLWILDRDNFKLLSEIDRAYLRFSKNHWEISAGRQRLGWGMNRFWNPNDIFNPFSFFNFDYEERPASDALSVTYHYGNASKLELASKAADDFEDYTGALLWKISQSGFNVQILAGLMEENIVVGTGWSGNIKSLGFTGEVSYFSALNPLEPDALVASVSVEYIFGENAFISGSYYYNSAGVRDANMEKFALVSAIPYSTKHIIPFSSAALVQISEPLSTRLYGSMTAIWFPGNNGGYWFPSLSYKIKKDLSMDFMSQLFTQESSRFIDPAHLQMYIRLQWSFQN